MQRFIAQSRMLNLALPLSLMLATGAVMAQAETERPPIMPPGQADRIVASTAELELLEAYRTDDGLVNEPVELMNTTFRQPNNRDRQLTISFHGECSAWLHAADEAIENGLLDENGEILAASVAVWVEVNGEPVPVAGNDAVPDDGTIVYCHANGEADLETADLVTLHHHSRSASGYAWVVTEAGQGDYEVSVKAQIELLLDDGNGEPDPIPMEEEPVAEVAAIFGKRTLTIEPGRVRIVDATPGNRD